MTWKSHIAIAMAITIPCNPAMIPVATIGATAPDWMEWVLKFFNIKIQHRGVTHYLIIPLIIIGISFFIDFKNILFWFGIGYFSHWFADSMTISGVPISQYDKHRIHFFGGKIKTGTMPEYIFAFSLLAISVLIFNPAKNFLRKDETKPMEFNVYYQNYEEMYENKVIDEKTYKEMRFNFF